MGNDEHLDLIDKSDSSLELERDLLFTDLVEVQGILNERYKSLFNFRDLVADHLNNV